MNYSNGEVIRIIGQQQGLAASQFNGFYCGLCFSADDGRFILVGEQQSAQISLFNVETGVLSKQIGADVIRLRNGWKDLVLLPNGNYLVSDVVTDTLHLLDSECVLIRSWHTHDPLAAVTESPPLVSVEGFSSSSTLIPFKPRAGALAVTVPRPFVHRRGPRGKLELFVLDARSLRVQVFE